MTLHLDDTRWTHALALCNKLMDIHHNIVHLTEAEAFDLRQIQEEAHEWQHTVVDLQEAVYSLRRVPVKRLFAKLSRIVRDLRKTWLRK